MESETDVLLEDLAGLFGEAEDMDAMDAADFVDNAGKIWDLRQRAKKILEEKKP
jgi:hypothetical protein